MQLSGPAEGESAVTDGTGRVPRLIVGISRSPASWWALAWAVGEARRRGARLLLVNVFRPPANLAAYETGPGAFGTPRDPYADHVAHGYALIRTAIGPPPGRWRGPARRSACPVVIVPEPPPSSLAVPLPDDHVRNHRFRDAASRNTDSFVTICGSLPAPCWRNDRFRLSRNHGSFGANLLITPNGPWCYGLSPRPNFPDGPSAR